MSSLIYGSSMSKKDDLLIYNIEKYAQTVKSAGHYQAAVTMRKASNRLHQLIREKDKDNDTE